MSYKLEKERLKRWSEEVLTRDGRRCRMCKKLPKKPNAHHLIPRIIKETRFDLQNGITLCAYCHRFSKTSPHQNAMAFTKWLETYEPYLFNYLEEKLIELRIYE